MTEQELHDEWLAQDEFLAWPNFLLHKLIAAKPAEAPAPEMGAAFSDLMGTPEAPAESCSSTTVTYSDPVMSLEDGVLEECPHCHGHHAGGCHRAPADHVREATKVIDKDGQDGEAPADRPNPEEVPDARESRRPAQPDRCPTPLDSIRECSDFIAKHQWAVEGNTQMQDVLAITARAFLKICDILEPLEPAWHSAAPPLTAEEAAREIRNKISLAAKTWCLDISDVLDSIIGQDITAIIQRAIDAENARLREECLRLRGDHGKLNENIAIALGRPGLANVFDDDVIRGVKELREQLAERERLIDIIDHLTGDDFCEELDCEVNLPGKTPTEFQKQVQAKLSQVFRLAHAFNPRNSCYSVHQVWRDELKKLAEAGKVGK